MGVLCNVMRMMQWDYCIYRFIDFQMGQIDPWKGYYFYIRIKLILLPFFKYYFYSV